MFNNRKKSVAGLNTPLIGLQLDAHFIMTASGRVESCPMLLTGKWIWKGKGWQFVDAIFANSNSNVVTDWLTGLFFSQLHGVSLSYWQKWWANDISHIARIHSHVPVRGQTCSCTVTGAMMLSIWVKMGSPMTALSLSISHLKWSTAEIDTVATRAVFRCKKLDEEKTWAKDTIM